ncbi:MAG: oxygen-dependent coproporphyrinogen oxidase [Pelagibacteraceae bacterium]
MNIFAKKKLINNWFEFLQFQICQEFIKLENNHSKKKIKFKKNTWVKKNKNEGGGVSYLLTGGKIFDKLGINKSLVKGTFKKEYRSHILGANKNGKYWAAGVSVVAHMKNPKMPALHFNTRFIATTKEWFGGGMDVTPSFNDIIEKNKIHQKLKKICYSNNKNYYKYKKLCDQYFYIPHRKEARGIGGLFFDYEQSNWENNFKFVRELGLQFVDITKEIVLNKIKKRWNKKDKEKQMIKRGKYIEFNLLYDRGTKFGLNSEGDIKSILMSLPPNPKWK